MLIILHHCTHTHTRTRAPDLQLGALQPQQLLSVHAAGAELGHQVLQVEAQQPAGHLLGAPVLHTAAGPGGEGPGELTLVQNLGTEGERVRGETSRPGGPITEHRQNTAKLDIKN